MNRENVLDEFYEIEPLTKDEFLKVKETLTRIGIPAKNPDNPQKPILWQSCHVFYKQKRYYICHFKQLFLLDGRTRVTDFTEDDKDRLEYITALLEAWELIRPLDEVRKTKINVTIIPYADKDKWELKTKYTIGVRKDEK